MKITYDDLSGFFARVSIFDPERTETGDPIGPHDRAILARLSKKLLKSWVDLFEWHKDVLAAMKEVQAKAHAILGITDIGEITAEQLTEIIGTLDADAKTDLHGHLIHLQSLGRSVEVAGRLAIHDDDRDVVHI